MIVIDTELMESRTSFGPGFTLVKASASKLICPNIFIFEVYCHSLAPKAVV